MSALKVYEERSKDLWGCTLGKNPLFISVRCPFKPVKAVTIGHWLKDVMKLAGIDTSVFTAHSTRSAATSKANSAGIPMSEIMKAVVMCDIAFYVYCILRLLQAKLSRLR